MIFLILFTSETQGGGDNIRTLRKIWGRLLVLAFFTFDFFQDCDFKVT